MAAFLSVIESIGKEADEKAENREHSEDSTLQIDEKELEEQVNDLGINGLIYFNYNLFITRLLGRFAPIFHLNCEHVLIVYILKQSRKKFRGFLKKNSRIFKILIFFYKNKKLLNTNFLNFYHS